MIFKLPYTRDHKPIVAIGWNPTVKKPRPKTAAQVVCLSEASDFIRCRGQGDSAAAVNRARGLTANTS